MMSLTRWPKVQALRDKLNGKAKAEPEYRFYLLYDKVYRQDFLEAAYALVKHNDSAGGVDGERCADIEAYGVERYLGELAEELRAQRYHPQPVQRVYIEKPGKPGEYRPLGIPTVRDRIVQESVKLLLDPIFEADLPEEAYGYRAGRSAHGALLAVDGALRAGYTAVVDADLSKYFDTIPHQELLRSVARRIADPKILALLKGWLKAPVHERNERGQVAISGGKRTKMGTPQGGVISPLLANIYFRRFLKAWEHFGLRRKLNTRIVNYADDFVIMTRSAGTAQAALAATRRLLTGLHLTLNEAKTRVCQAWQDSFNFLGYRFGKLYRTGGRAYLGLTLADKSVKRYRERVQALTAEHQLANSAETVATALNRVTQGFWNYFRLGTISRIGWKLDHHLYQRMLRWAQRKYTRSRAKTGAPDAGRRRRWARIQAALALLRPRRPVRPKPASANRGSEWVDLSAVGLVPVRS